MEVRKLKKEEWIVSIESNHIAKVNFVSTGLLGSESSVERILEKP